MRINYNIAIDELHQQRYENYEETKHMTDVELIEYTQSEIADSLQLLAELKREKQAVDTTKKIKASS